MCFRGYGYGKLAEPLQAVADYTAAIDLCPNYAKAYFNRGTVYNQLKEYQRAIADFDRAILLNNEYLDAYYNRGIAIANYSSIAMRSQTTLR